jgi:hypothetical protein
VRTRDAFLRLAGKFEIERLIQIWLEIAVVQTIGRLIKIELKFVRQKLLCIVLKLHQII